MAPPGYEKAKIKSINLKGKQVYLAQVPSDFDAKKAEFKSDTEVSCDGTTYFVNTSASVANCEILTTDPHGKLVPDSKKITGLLAFTKKVALPKIDYEKVTEEKPLVPQHKNMRMRHFPTGYGPKSFGIEESKAAPATPPASPPATPRKRSDKHEDEPSKKKHKKSSSSSEHSEKKKKKSHKHKEKS